MPSALTGDIYDNENNSAKDYIIRCSKTFGALLHMRDFDLDAPPKLFPLDLTSHDKDIAEAKTKIDYYTNMSVEEVEQQIEQDYLYKQQCKMVYDQGDTEILTRYEKVLEQVKAWEVPESLDNLKEYATNHLVDQINHLLGGINRRNEREAEEVPGQMIHHEVWRSERIEWAEEDLKRAEEHKERARKAIEEKNAWITDLLTSLESVK